MPNSMSITLRALTLSLAGLLATAAAGCTDREVNERDPSDTVAVDGDDPSTSEPAYITVDHILIGVSHPRLKGVDRTAQQARKLAYELKLRLDAGEDWQVLKDEFSDDRSASGTGGPYAMANIGHKARNENETPRNKMVSAFGDVGFALDVGGIDVADYDPVASKYGYHIIKRVK